MTEDELIVKYHGFAFAVAMKRCRRFPYLRDEAASAANMALFRSVRRRNHRPCSGVSLKAQIYLNIRSDLCRIFREESGETRNFEKFCVFRTTNDSSVRMSARKNKYKCTAGLKHPVMPPPLDPPATQKEADDRDAFSFLASLVGGEAANFLTLRYVYGFEYKEISAVSARKLSRPSVHRVMGEAEQRLKLLLTTRTDSGNPD